MLPNFIIVGAPKAGTTSLYHYLSGHPQVFMSTPKEVNYFSHEEIEAQNLYYDYFKVDNQDEYEQLFEAASDEMAIGEANVSYLFYPETPAKIKKIIPDCKIIIILRDPVERGFSHYLMDYRLGLVKLPYDEIIYKQSDHKHIDLYYQQYVELGLYYEQVKRYLDIFGPDQIKIYLTEELRENIAEVIRDLYRFLDLDDKYKINMEGKHNTFSMPKNRLIHKLYASNLMRNIASFLIPKSLKEYVTNILFETKQKPRLNIKAREYLQKIYQSDISKLEQLTDRDLSAWYKNKK